MRAYSVGNTPMIRLGRLGAGLLSEIYAKVEGLNPGGSIKDRAALFMIRDAEGSGALKEGMTIIEPTSGNTGIGLAMVGAFLGYRCVIVMPDTMSAERISLMRAFGAEVVLTPGAEGMAGALKEADRLKEELGGFIPSQFSNPSNAMAHQVTTAAEILEQVPDVELGDFAVFADYFFDGLFADLFVQSRIREAQEQVEAVTQRVERLIVRLRDERENLEEKQGQLDWERERLLTAQNRAQLQSGAETGEAVPV